MHFVRFCVFGWFSAILLLPQRKHKEGVYNPHITHEETTNKKERPVGLSFLFMNNMKWHTVNKAGRMSTTEWLFRGHIRCRLSQYVR